MAIVTTWKITDMKRDAATGGVDTVFWECRVAEETPLDELGNVSTGAVAKEMGKLRLTPDSDAADFIAYDDLTEATVLGWVYNSLIEGDETAEEAKTRIETDRQAKVTAKIARRTAEASGMPW